MAAALPLPRDRLAARINVTPLVDVMLVLLVIFLLAVPVATRRLPLSNGACVPKCKDPGEPVRLAIKAAGEMFWNGAPVTRAGLAANLAALARHPTPAIEVHPQRGVRYDRVTDVLAAAQDAGVQRIGIAALEE